LNTRDRRVLSAHGTRTALLCLFMPFLERLSDRSLAILIAVAGLVSITTAFAFRTHPFDMAPAMDGVFTCGLLAFVLPMLHGLGWRRTLQIVIPIASVQLACFVGRGVLPLAPLGVQALLCGVVGIIATTPYDHEVKASEGSSNAIQAHA
jgi:hypothetical protein